MITFRLFWCKYCKYCWLVMCLLFVIHVLCLNQSDLQVRHNLNVVTLPNFYLIYWCNMLMRMPVVWLCSTLCFALFIAWCYNSHILCIFNLIMMIALSLSNLLDFCCVYMWHLQFVVVMLCYIISLRPVRYIVLRTLSFISLRSCFFALCFIRISIHLRWSRFALAICFFYLCWHATFQRHYV